MKTETKMRILLYQDDNDIAHLQEKLTDLLTARVPDCQIDLVTTPAAAAEALVRDGDYDVAIFGVVGDTTVNIPDLKIHIGQRKSQGGFCTGLILAQKLAKKNLLPPKTIITAPTVVILSKMLDSTGDFPVFDDTKLEEISEEVLNTSTVPELRI